VKRIVIRVLAVAAALAVGFVGTVWIDVHRAPADNAGEVVRVTVPAGQPFALLVHRLQGRGLIRSARVLRLYAAATRADRHIHTGTFEFTVGERPVDILRRLVEGDILRVSVTVPEGYAMWEIAGSFRAAAIDSVDMLAAIRNPAERQRREIRAPSLEGYLFPDTYQVAWGATAGEVVEQMLARMDRVFDAELIQLLSEREMTPHEVLTLASIIEAEARVASERPVISAVYHNRLARGMRLEADPTVAYAMDGYRGRLLFRDLEIDSPYNTYRNMGLPPGPICSPGEASIRAAVSPADDVDALYFVARGDGSHVFSRSLREHRQAVEAARRERRAQANG